MSNYGRRHGARIRRLYTGEPLQTAMQGIVRRGGLGLDECTPVQLNLRVLLALHLFNWGPASALHTTSSAVGTLTHYDIIMSPRYDELVMITNAPENVTGYLAPDGNDIRVPGVRMLGVDNHEYRLIHLPTCARIRVTRDPGCHPGRPLAHRREWWTPEVALTVDEKDYIAAMPVPTPTAATMITALLTRLNCTDPEKAWTGSWLSDPLNRDRPPLTLSNISRQLTGGGSQWLLRWNGYPYADDLARMLTDPDFGLHGTVADHDDGRIDLQRGSDILRLRPIK